MCTRPSGAVAFDTAPVFWFRKKTCANIRLVHAEDGIIRESGPGVNPHESLGREEDETCGVTR